MEARQLRKLNPGDEYDHLFSGAPGDDRRIKRDAGVEDTLALILKTVPQTAWQTSKLAKALKGADLDETCSNIWHFVYEHIQYRLDDKGMEQVRSPRRTWRDRKRGGDCDDFAEFISSILYNLGIAHKLRIAVYDFDRGFQHIYPVVPKDGKLSKPLFRREDYIVIDCVKDEYDDEQPFLQTKDYPMQLHYLDGLEGTAYNEEVLYAKPMQGADMAGPDSLYGDMGSLKSFFSKAGDKLKQGIRVVNRYANPATILLRNGFLAAMQVNLMNVAGRLRFAYLTDDQARKMNLNMNELNRLRSIKDRAETVYFQAGGEKQNLKKAILNGKGNKDKKVPLSGLDGLGEVYADQEEYDIMQRSMSGLGQLGEPATIAAMTAAAGAVAAVAASLKDIKNLFIGGSNENKVFQSENPDGNVPTVTATTPGMVYSPTTVQPGSAVNVPFVDPFAPNPTNPQIGTQSKGVLEKATEWVKTNPAMTMIIVGAAGTGVYLFRKSNDPPKRKSYRHLSGLPKKRKRKKSGSSRRKAPVALLGFS